MKNLKMCMTYLFCVVCLVFPALSSASDLATWDDVKIGKLSLGTVSAVPTAYVGLLQVDIREGTTSAATSPGIGLELRINADSSKELGLGIVGSVTSGGYFAPGATISFLRYGVAAFTFPFKGINGRYTFGHALFYAGLGYTF
jgi:hypothetical protein